MKRSSVARLFSGLVAPKDPSVSNKSVDAYSSSQSEEEIKILVSNWIDGIKDASLLIPHLSKKKGSSAIDALFNAFDIYESNNGIKESLRPESAKELINLGS